MGTCYFSFFFSTLRDVLRHLRDIRVFEELKMDLQGCPLELRDWFLLQVSNGASMHHMTLIPRVQEVFRMSYSRFWHFVSKYSMDDLKSAHNVLKP